MLSVYSYNRNKQLNHFLRHFVVFLSTGQTIAANIIDIDTP